MIEMTIGANNAKMLAIAKQVTDTFSRPGEHELRIDAEDVHGEWATLVFSSEDTTDRDDWDPDCVIIEHDA